MALDNLSGQRIQETYQKLVQTENGAFADGNGTAISIVTATQTGSFAVKSAISGAFADASQSLQSRITFVESELTNTLISGSSQIATDISGAFDEVSSSISSRLKTLESTEDHLHNNTISGSIQIAVEISGAFDEVSSSLASRLDGFTTDYTELTNIPIGILSSSNQIATEISGAINEVSASVQSRLAVIETELSNTLISGSSQIATEISGAFTATSQSLQSRIVTNVTNTTANSNDILVNTNNITSLTAATSSYLLNTTDTITGNLTVTGIITAEEFHTEFVTSSVIFASGSSRIGNTSDDIHQFTGSVFISGSSLKINGADVLTESPFTSTAISGAFNGQTGSFLTESPFTATAISGAFNGQTGSFLTESPFTATAISGAFNGQTGSFLTESPFTATAISGAFFESSESLASRVTLVEGGLVTLPNGLISGSDHIFTAITASGNISASGLLFISASTTASALNTLMYDTATGQIYYTGSYGGGGGSTISTGTGFPFEGDAVITGSLIVSGTVAQDVKIFNDILPGTSDEYTLGTSTNKWNAVFATNTFFGGIHEINLETIGISQLQTGTVLVSKAGQMVPCDTKGDALVMGVVTSGSDYPIIMGAEPVLVDGPVYEGDYIITSNRLGYGTAVPPDKIYEERLFGKIIAQSLETNLSGGSIKAMIRKM